MEKKVTTEEFVNALASPFIEVLDGVGITKQYLAKRIKKEINAKETRTVKIKGAVSDNNLPKTAKNKVKRGYRIVTSSGVLSYQKTEGGPEQVFGDGDTLVEIDYHNWTISQKARMDANKLRGDYPAVKHEVAGPDGAPLFTSDLTEEERAALKTLCEERKKQLVADSLKSD